MRETTFWDAEHWRKDPISQKAIAEMELLKERVQELEGLLAEEELAHDGTLKERDAYHEWADRLTEGVEDLLDVDCGEHSNLNNPWKEACEYLEGEINRKAKETEDTP